MYGMQVRTCRGHDRRIAQGQHQQPDSIVWQAAAVQLCVLFGFLAMAAVLHAIKVAADTIDCFCVHV